MLSKQAREIRSYLSSDEGRGILRTARMVLKANNIKIVDDDARGLKSLAMAYALYPNQLKQATGGLISISKEAVFKGVDFCSADPSLCKGRKPIPRIEMPVLEGNNLMLVTKNLSKGLIDWENPPKNPALQKYVPIMKGRLKGRVVPLQDLSVDQLIEYGIDETTVGYKYHQYSANGDKKVKVQQVNVPAIDLKPTQSEINFEKAFGMVKGYLTNKFKALTQYDPNTVSLISKEGYIVDGHHRWAAIGLLNTYSPEKLIGTKSGDKYDTSGSLEELWTQDASNEVPAWLSKNKGGGDPSLSLACMAFNLPMKDLLPCLNACTDSLKVMRKPFDDKDPKEVAKVIIPSMGYELQTHKEYFDGDESATTGLKDILNRTKEVDESEFSNVYDTFSRVARLRKRLNLR